MIIPRQSPRLLDPVASSEGTITERDDNTIDPGPASPGENVSIASPDNPDTEHQEVSRTASEVFDLNHYEDDPTIPSGKPPVTNGQRIKTTGKKDNEVDLSKSPKAMAALNGKKEEDDTGPSDEQAEVAATTESKSTLDQPARRNYEGFDAEETKVLKNMKNEHFTLMSKRLMEYKGLGKELEGSKSKIVELEKTLTDRGVPPAWHDHPEAFTLSPEYGQLSQQYNDISFEQEHYQRQLVAIKEGKPWSPLKGFDKNGNPVLGSEQPPSNQAEAQVSQGLTNLAIQEANARGKVAALQHTFKQSHEAAKGAVYNELNKHINNLRPDLKPEKPAIDLMINALPPQFRNNPLAPALGTLYGLTVKLASHIKSLEEKKTMEAKIAADTKAAGVNTRALPRNGTTNNPTTEKTITLPDGKRVPAVFDMAEFKTNDED